MGYGSFLSALLHICVFALSVLGVDLFDRKPAPTVAIAVETARLSDIVPEKPAPAPPSAPAEPPPAPAAPEPEPELAIPEPRPVPPDAPPEPPAPPPEAVPPAPPPEIPKPKADAPKPRTKPAPPRPKATAGKTPAPPRKPKPPSRIQSVLKNLDKLAEAPKPAPRPKELSPLERASEARKRGEREAAIVRQLTDQLAPCWNVAAGVKGAADIRVPVRIRLRPDGSLAGAPRLQEPGRMRNDPVYRAVAESALRALQNPRCVPFRLPYARYDLWKDVIFSFDPKEMLGG